MEWYKLFESNINFNVQTKVAPTKGNLVYEYNPFRNYRINQPMYEYKNGLYSIEDLNKHFGISLSNDNKTWIGIDYAVDEIPTLRESGELCDFITDELSFSLDHPVHIVPQYSYDGSVNLIINDGLNIPRLINSRFSATGKNTYEVIDRKGNNDTNIYDQGEQFDIDTSLYKRVIKIPKIDFKGVSSGGQMPIGNYHFYFKLSDADGNESDFVGESGLVSVFIGFDSPSSITTGQKNENSCKQIDFRISNIDSSYDYVTVYYSRYTAESDENMVTEYKKIEKKFPVNNAEVCNIIITGAEPMINITASDVNLQYNTVDNTFTSTTCQNMLFMANVHKPDIPYKELFDLSLRFLPYLKEESYGVDMDENYGISTVNRGYVDPKFIYEKTGYWSNEIYRFGIVYIMKNGDLSPVFNVRGGCEVGTKDSLDRVYNQFPVKNNNKRVYINYNEETYYILPLEEQQLSENSVLYENVKGVVRFKATKDTDTIYSVDFRVDNDVIEELKKYVKGYFFVRQTRIPTILAQGITIGIDKEAHTPTIPTADGFLTEVRDSLEKTHVTTEDINDVNFISEGFLTRYSFKLKKKSSSLWGKIGKIAAVTVGVVALAAACVFAGPAVAAAAGTVAGAAAAGGTATTLAVATAAASAGWAAVTSSAVVIGSAIAGAAAVVGTAIAGAIQETRYGIASMFTKKKLDGRNTEVPPGYKIEELENSRTLSQDFLDRFIPKDPKSNYIAGIVCPDYELNQPLYNQIFTGNEHLIKSTTSQSINFLNGHSTNYFTNRYRHFYIPAYYDKSDAIESSCKIVSVPDNVKCVGLDNMKFRSRAGEAEEAWRYECISEDYKSDYSKSDGNEEDEETTNNKKINSDIVRGSFGPYLAINDISNRFAPAETVNIYIPGYKESNMDNYFYIRMMDSSSFYAITDRIDINYLDDYWVTPKSPLIGDDYKKDGLKFNAYRGDCYLCQFTHRINRNFNDPSAPYNDEIVDKNTWKENYDPTDPEKYQQINLGDVNAIQMGMWITFKVRSSNNLNIRTLDGSYVDESAMIGHPRGYFPYHQMSVEGVYKTPESQVQNRGFSKSVSERWNFEVPDVPHIKNWFKTRIMYSDIHINDAYKNGFRVFRGQNYRDYTREYGEIVKLISLESNLLCVFEHGVALIPVNERAVAGQGAGGNVYINTSNVLPENPKIISDMFGSQWPESVLKVPGRTGDAPQYVYGVDTVAKKIWRTDGNTLECISDFKVQEFLNNSITLGERELTPKIGIRNVKTHYNAFKRDVMFTFYDNTYGFEEKVWNLCWNELLQKFITFYSWVPSYMENINNIPFSFDRNTSKWVAKLGTSHADNSFADGITLSNNIIENNREILNNKFNYDYITTSGERIEKEATFTGIIPNYTCIGVLSLSNRTLPDESTNYQITYDIEHDIYGNHKLFKIDKVTTNADFANSKFNNSPDFYGLYIKSNSISNLFSELYYRNIANILHSDINQEHKKSWQELGINTIIDNNYPIFKDSFGKRPTLDRDNMLNPDKIVTLLNIRANITIFDETGKVENLSDWHYNKQAQYTGTNMGYYETVVAVIPRWNLQFLSTDFWRHGQAGIFDITESVKPTHWYDKKHPFEFEVVVANDPGVHKIFDNLELVANKAKPESFHYEIVGECYDFAKDKPNMYFRQEALKAIWQYNGADICYNRDFIKTKVNQQPRSADLPHKYYTRKDTINEIEDSYISFTSINPDYRHLSGSELVHYPTRQEYRIWNHAKAIDLNDLRQDDARSLIASNCQYLEDRWKITINPILVCYKNEYIIKPNYIEGFAQLTNSNSDWPDRNKPKLPVYNSPIPDESYEYIKDNNDGNIYMPPELANLGYEPTFNTYDSNGKLLEKGYLDDTNWLSENSIYGTTFGEAQNRKEVSMKDRFIKVRIRYSGDELAIIDYLNTLYRVSYT